MHILILTSRITFRFRTKNVENSDFLFSQKGRLLSRLSIADGEKSMGLNDLEAQTKVVEMGGEITPKPLFQQTQTAVLFRFTCQEKSKFREVSRDMFGFIFLS